jgi:hypothetical protein
MDADIDPRPYFDTSTGQTVLMTDHQFNQLQPGHSFRRLAPGEHAPPPTDMAQQVSRMENDGAPSPNVEE